MQLDAVEFCDDLPSADEFFELFATTGWNATYKVDANDLEAALKSSWKAVSAYSSAQLLGFGRMLSDGLLYAILLDVIVDPDFRPKGIGGEIVRRLVRDCIDANIRDIQLFSAVGKVNFYERLGFVVRHADSPGMRFSSLSDSSRLPRLSG